MKEASLAVLQNGTIVTKIKTKLLTKCLSCSAQAVWNNHQQKTGGLASCQPWSPGTGKGKE